MGYQELYNLWSSDPYFDEEDRQELLKLKDKKDIEDRFYKELEFGTGGLRGIMGLGSNRMNKYNIRKASCGFAKYLLNKYSLDVKKGVAIAYDTRHNSKEFAKEAALCFVSYGIPVYLYNIISATPLLSFTVRKLGLIAGVVVTSSHNPKEYNGYKAYNKNGCQLSVKEAEEVISFINATDVRDIKTTTEEKALKSGLLKYIGEEMISAYSKAVRDAFPKIDYSANSELKIAYSPLHGCGSKTVYQVLKDAGFFNIELVKEQFEPNGDFPTVKSPNPGNKASLDMVKKLAEKVGSDIAVATDPDADRVGVYIKHKDKFEFLGGNQIGALIFYYLCDLYKNYMPANPYLVTTIVTGELSAAIAKKHNIEVYRVLTGFKFICGLEDELNAKGKHFIFGYEESFGYVSGDYARDKCAAFSALALCSACSYYKKQGKDLGEVMDEIAKEYGYYKDDLNVYIFPGKEGAEKMQDIMKKLHELGNKLLPGIVEIKDYNEGIDGLPKSDVLKYFFDDGSWLAIRPSGTEPQIKTYYSTIGKTKAEAQRNYKERKAVIDGLIN